jgi:molybdopterin-guanine dinucleotide biosynthesis protein A
MSNLAENQNTITGIILSGGKSIRMGENKAFIEIEGIPIIKRIHLLFKKLFQEVIIVKNQKEFFINLNAEIYSDLFPNRGVLGGLYTGIYFSSFPYSFCVACDMPFLKKPVIEYLIKNIQGDDIVVPRTKDGLQPLHAIYSKNCLEPINKIMKQGKYKIIDFYPMVKVKIIEEDEFHALDPMRESFMNVNTPEELLLARKREHIK